MPRRINAFLQTWMSLTKGLSQAHSLLTARLVGAQEHSSPEGSRVFSMESHAMHNRLQVSFWGLHLTAEGIVGIAAAMLIVIVVVAASRF